MIKSGLSALYKILGAALTAQFTLRSQGTPFRTRSASPSAPRYWHDPTDSAHIDRMQAAEDRRDWRAEKLMQQANRSWSNNYAHHNAFRTLENISGFVQPLTLNPFYVAK